MHDARNFGLPGIATVSRIYLMETEVVEFNTTLDTNDKTWLFEILDTAVLTKRSTLEEST